MKTIFVMLTILLTGLLGIILLRKAALQEIATKIPVEEVPTNIIFSKLARVTESQDRSLSPEVEKSFKNPSDKLVFQYGWNLKQIQTEEDTWNPEEIPVTGKISQYNQQDRTAKLTFYEPANFPLYGQQHVTKLPTDCTATNSYIKDESTGYTRQTSDFYNEIKDGRYITSFCTDTSCTALNKLCKISYYQP